MIFDVPLILEENTVEYFLMRGVLDYIGSVDVRYLIHHLYILMFPVSMYGLFIFDLTAICTVLSPELCYLHHELLNLMLVLMSTQLCSGPSPEPKDVHPFLDAAMLQVKAETSCASYMIIYS
jgi:dymeclin